MPKVSVVIPCFNLGKYLPEAINSVTAQTYRDFEIIVVNDGSTEPETKSVLDDLDTASLLILHTDNQGLAAARNNGIARATGEYILPLDADDKIAPPYLEKAVRVLDSNKRVGIVYCQAEFFGEQDAKWELPEYELPRMLIDNLIFASAFFRRKDWQAVGGYKPLMKYGWEDYEFWLSIIELKREVFRLPEYLFFYRQRGDSMANAMTKEHLRYSYRQIVENHRELYLENIQYIFEYLYSQRGDITEKRQELIARDTRIHHLNLEIGRLNAEVSELKSQLSNVRPLARLLLKSLARKFIPKG